MCNQWLRCVRSTGAYLLLAYLVEQKSTNMMMNLRLDTSTVVGVAMCVTLYVLPISFAGFTSFIAWRAIRLFLVRRSSPPLWHQQILAVMLGSWPHITLPDLLKARASLPACISWIRKLILGDVRKLHAVQQQGRCKSANFFTGWMLGKDRAFSCGILWQIWKWILFQF